jgi:hypothetical protein
MPKPNLSPEVTIWTDARHAPLVGELMNLMGSALKPIGIGGPPAAQVSSLAKELGYEPHDDLRKLLVDRPAAYLLMASLEAVTPDDLYAITDQGTTALTLEPIASDLQGLSASLKLGSGAGSGVGGRIIQAPTFGQTPGFLSSADPYELLGDRRAIRFTSDGLPGHGSLFARLLDAWMTVLSFTLTPESIDASLVGTHNDPPEDLRSLTGTLLAHARLPGSNAVLLEVSDTAVRTARELRVQGDSASLRITDSAYSLTGPDAKVLDETDTAGPSGFVDMLAYQWRRLLDQPHPAGTTQFAQQQAEAMACCLACQLSIRTGQPESPGKLLEMNR